MADSDAEIAKKLNNLKKEAKSLAIKEGKILVILDELEDAKGELTHARYSLNDANKALKKYYSSNSRVVARKREKIQFQIDKLEKLASKITAKRGKIILSQQSSIRQKLVKISDKAYKIASTIDLQIKNKKVLTDIGYYTSKYSSAYRNKNKNKK